MIGIPKVGNLEHIVVLGHVSKGPLILARDGTPVTLAAVGPDGEVIEMGDQVTLEVWKVAIATYKNFMAGNGYLTVHIEPTGIR